MDCETVATTSRLDVISRVMDKTLSYLVALLLVAMSGVVFGNVVCRYLLDLSLGWYEEISRFLLIWIVFLGAVIALIKGDHLSIDLLLFVLSPRACRVAAVVALQVGLQLGAPAPVQIDDRAHVGGVHVRRQARDVRDRPVPVRGQPAPQMVVRVHGGAGGALHEVLGDPQGRVRQAVAELQVAGAGICFGCAHRTRLHPQAQVTLQSAHIWRKVPTNERT